MRTGPLRFSLFIGLQNHNIWATLMELRWEKACRTWVVEKKRSWAKSLQVTLTSYKRSRNRAEYIAPGVQGGWLGRRRGETPPARIRSLPNESKVRNAVASRLLLGLLSALFLIGE